jgi:RimK family alpha-L-glutamate ligase
MKGLIFINPFLIPKQSVHQAERLKEEFNKLGVKVDIVTDGYLRVNIDGTTRIDLPETDFAVYLDKDKYLSEVLEKSGLRLFNRHDAVRVCDDKAQTYIALSNNGINLPTTIFGALCYNDACKISEGVAEKIGSVLGFPVIVKESFGSMGKGIHKADDQNQLREIMEKVKTKPHLFQSYLGKSKGVDVRVIVIGGKAIASMERRNDCDFRSNVAQGGKGVKIDLPEKFRLTAEKCAKILGLDYCGVDLLYGENGEPFVCEVNSNAFFDGIEEVSGVNVAKTYAEHIVKTIEKSI